MPHLHLDFENHLGNIKPMHAVGHPPFSGGFLKFDFSHMAYLQKASIPYSRLHDIGGTFGGNRFVDIPNIFRDFDADENDPESYDFAFTDELIKAMVNYELKPIFRLGVTIENQCHIKAYRIHPPKDFAKWARICEHIIRHYNEGWANGFKFGIEYWEIWNEPENGPTPQTNQMWTGTAEQYYELYDVTAKHLKACFGNSIKVGGYGASSIYGIFYEPQRYGLELVPQEPDERCEKGIYRVEFLIGFIKYIKRHSSPIDFFSWHSYTNVEETKIMDSYIYKSFAENGYKDIELHLNEWNNAFGNANHGTSYASASTAAMLCAMQDSHTHMLCYYDARITASCYGGFFAPLTYLPVCTYYSFVAFGELYKLGKQAECLISNGDQIYAIAATDGSHHAVLISNTSEKEQILSTELKNDFSAYILDKDHYLTKADLDLSSIKLGKDQVLFISNF